MILVNGAVGTSLTPGSNAAARASDRSSRELGAPDIRHRLGLAAAAAALVAGLAYVAISAYWALGGTWLLATVSSSLVTADQSTTVSDGRVGRGRPQRYRCTTSLLPPPTRTALEMARPTQVVGVGRRRGTDPLRIRLHLGGSTGTSRRHPSVKGHRPARLGLAHLPLGSVVPRLGPPRGPRPRIDFGQTNPPIGPVLTCGFLSGGGRI